MPKQNNALINALAKKYNIKPKIKGADAIAALDFAYNMGRGKAYASKITPCNNETYPITLKAELIGLAEASGMPGDTHEWLEGERTRLGLPEAHGNLLYLSIIMTHTDKVMENYNHDVLLRDEAEKALPSLMLQPVDISWDYDWWDDKLVAFDHHEREGLTGINGIRGVIYASRFVDDAIQVGAAIWARDFPDIANALVYDAEFLGASFDLVGQRYEMDGGNRHLLDLEFCGCTILYRHLAADRDTSIGDMNYMGENLSDVMEAAAQKGVPVLVLNNKATAAVAAKVDAPSGAEEAKEDMDKIAELEAKISELDAKIASQAEAMTAKDAEIVELKAKNTELTSEKEKLDGEVTALTARAEKAESDLKGYIDAQAAKELGEKRMGELLQIGEFADESAKAEAAEKLPSMDEKDYELFMVRHENAILKANAAKVPVKEDTRSTAARGGLGGLQPGAGADTNPANLRKEAQSDVVMVDA